MRLLCLTILITSLLSCNNKKVVRESVEIKEYEFTDELRETKRGSLTLIKNDSKIQFGYNETETDSVFDYSLTQDLNNDSILINDNNAEICHLIEQRSYSINGQSTEVKKYRYDLATSIDEEASFYFIDNYGLIGIVGATGNYLFFSKKTELDSTIIKILKADKTGFFKIVAAPLSLPKDFNSSEIDSELDTIK